MSQPIRGFTQHMEDLENNRGIVLIINVSHITQYDDLSETHKCLGWHLFAFFKPPKSSICILYTRKIIYSIHQEGTIDRMNYTFNIEPLFLFKIPGIICSYKFLQISNILRSQ